MTKIRKNNRLIKKISLLIQYAVPQSDIDSAVRFIEGYSEREEILRLLEEYYSTLPEGREEAVTSVATVDSRKGVFLLALSTKGHAYLYAVSADEIIWLGEYGADIEPEILHYFGHDTQKAFWQKCPPHEDLPEYGQCVVKSKDICPACGVEENEKHLLGCSVEVCPWCDGQLSRCNCRFEQLRVEEIETNKQLETFQDLLEAKGRIPYKGGQKPAYPGTSAGFDRTSDSE